MFGAEAVVAEVGCVVGLFGVEFVVCAAVGVFGAVVRGNLVRDVGIADDVGEAGIGIVRNGANGGAQADV